MARHLPTRWAAGFAACLFLLVLGAKWAVVDRFGSAMPDWDQWDGEALHLLIPWFTGRDFLENLLYPHNEHRIVLTKLQTLGLTLLNGQWDSRLLAVVNAVLHSAVAAAFWLIGRRWAAPGWQAPLFVLTAALFALPFAWQNTLGAFHSQQYWLVALSFAAIVSLPFARPLRAGWWLAVAVGALALLTMGSGLLAAAVVLAVAAFRCWRGEAAWRESWPTFVAAGAITALGLAARVEVDFHAALKAGGAGDFVLSTLRSMAWPLRDHDWAAVIFWCPWLFALIRLLRAPRDGAELRGGETIAALGGWVMLQILATAYARGIGADYPASRYMDTLAVGAFANGAALAWLASTARSAGWRRATVLFALAWTALLGVGLHRHTRIALRHDFPAARGYYDRAERNLRAYLATDNPAQLQLPDIPYPSAETLIERLSTPELRRVMPAAVRAPLPLEPAAGATDGFVPNLADGLRPEPPSTHGLSPATPPLDNMKSWGSFTANGAAEIGEWRSAPLRAPRGWLKFELAGHAGQIGVSVELHDARTGAVLDEIMPARMPGDRWRSAYVRAPAGPFLIVAGDRDPRRWVAFSAPVEVAPLSYWAWRISKHGLLILYLAAATCMVLAVAAMAKRRRGRSRRAALPEPAPVQANSRA